MSRQSLTESLRETLALFDSPGRPLTTNEVAERLDLGRRSTYNRLDRLVDSGRLETKKVGASARVWWRPPSTPSADRPGSTSNWTDVTESLVGDVLDGADVGVFVFDEDFDVAWVNETARRYFGLGNADVAGRDKRALVDESLASVVDDSASFAETVLATHDENTDAEQFECHVTAGDGREERWLEHRSKPIESGTFAGGRVELYCDVTDRERTKQERKEDREQFESLVAAVEEYAIFKLDADGRIQTWNSGAERIKGYDPEEVLGEHVSLFYTDEDRAANVPEENLAAAAEAGWIEEEGWRVREDGSRFWANVAITAILDDDGELEGYAKVTRDMTERREYEQQLREEKAFVESVFDDQRDVVYAFDTDGELLRWNDRLREVVGYTDAEISGMSPQDFVADEAVAELTTAIEQVLRGDSVALELPLETADDARIPYEFSASPITDDGEVVGVTGIGRDVSERKRRRRQLERQRDDLERELKDVFGRVDDAFFALDEEWQFTHVNERAAALLDRSVGDLVGQNIWEAFPEAADTTFQGRYERALETQESVSFEEFYPPLGVWFEVTAYPSESGLSVYFRDVTERKEREHELEQYERIVETVGDGVYILDESHEFRMVNSAFESMTDYDRYELIGSHAELVFGEEYVDIAEEKQGEMEDVGESVAVFEEELYPADDEPIIVESRFALIGLDDGKQGRIGTVRDVTDRVERERELEQYETIVETVDDGIYVVDDDARFALVNEGLCELTGYDREELLGSHATLVHDEEITSRAESMADQLAADEREVASIELEVQTKTGDTVSAESRLAPFPMGGSYGRCGVVRDVSDRLERERTLQRQVHQQEVVADLGQRALENRDVDALMAEASELVADTLDNEYCKVLELDAPNDELRLRQGVGWDDGIVGSTTVSAVDDDSQAAHTLRTDQPVVVNDLAAETRFSGPDLLTTHDVRSGVSVLVGPQNDPWGILGTHDVARKEFSEHEVNFVQSVAAILASATTRRRHEEELVRQREQLAALDNLNEVVREITDAVIDQSTREEIEATVCEHLADSESYLFAWVGDVDVASETVTPRTEAGVEGYLDEVSISVDPDDDRSAGATGRALQTGEVQTTQDIVADDRYSPWREHIEEHGFRSSAAIPIVHEETVYGVLNVYAERPEAFEGQERAVLGQLGEVVGHAIAAAERKQALMSDEIVELEFHIRDVFGALGVDVETTGRITLDHAIPVENDEYVVYGSATADAVDSVRSLVETLPHWEKVTFRDGDGDVPLELRLSEPPVLSVVASLGGSVESAVIEDGDYDMTLHVAPSADIRQVIDTVKEHYPSAQLLKRQQAGRHDEPSERMHRELTTDLTDRQRATLEAAYHAGFFEWPRDASGEEVASSLGISPPTFHQHLRKAEQQVFDQFLSASTTAATR